jgi:predicted component of type VI protein secretion system
MPAQLLALSEGPNILLDKPIMLFGRNPECDIQIESRKISRRHCCIAQVHDYLVVRDLGSTNGIRINGVRVVEGRLRAGDELTIGSHRYQIRLDPLESRAGRTPPSVVVERAPPPPRAPVPLDDDELLEECDEPIPLQEPDGKSPPPSPRPPTRAIPAVNTALGDDEEEDPLDVESVADEQVPPPVLPDNLNLAPSSDVYRPDRSKAQH